MSIWPIQSQTAVTVHEPYRMLLFVLPIDPYSIVVYTDYSHISWKNAINTGQGVIYLIIVPIFIQ